MINRYYTNKQGCLGPLFSAEVHECSCNGSRKKQEIILCSDPAIG